MLLLHMDLGEIFVECYDHMVPKDVHYVLAFHPEVRYTTISNDFMKCHICT